MNLYVARDGESLGPYSEDQTREYLKAGIFAPEELACREGEENWRPLQSFLSPPLKKIPVPPRTAAPPRPPSRPTPTREQEFYNADGITVTNARFIVGPQTYAMRNISSVQMSEKEPDNGVAAVLCILGVLCLCGFANDAATAGFCGLIMLVVGIVLFVQAKPTFIVLLTTNAGQVKAVANQKRAEILTIVEALNNAIVSHAA